MKLFLLFVSVICGVSCKKESVWQDLLNDPQVLIELEKRIGNLAGDLEVGCYANNGILKSECEFHANGSTIIKTTESIGRGAKFLVDFVNVSCPRDCTSRCCENPECDTAVFQDKGDRKCYLFHCGDSSLCVFSHHADYWMSSVSKAAHTSHGYTPGGATYSHENELENLGSGNQETDPPEPQRTTTVAPTTERISPNLPGLGEYCSSYEAVCDDPHAYCLMKQCQCRVGYHEKHGICRKHCRDEELECENIRYGADSLQCVPQQYVCDGNPDCVDGSDEKDCPTLNKPAFLNRDGNVYNSPFYNAQYNRQQDTQYPYGFPSPHQKQTALDPSTNQVKPGQNVANQNVGGQYKVPDSNQDQDHDVNMPPAGGQVNQQWASNNVIGSKPYQHGVQDQAGQQQSYTPPQTGYVQSRLQQVQQVNPNLQPVQQNVQDSQTALQNSQQIQGNQASIQNGNQAAMPVQAGNQNIAPKQKLVPTVPPVQQRPQNQGNTDLLDKSLDPGYFIDDLYDTVTDKVDIVPSRNRFPFDRIHDDYAGQLSDKNKLQQDVDTDDNFVNHKSKGGFASAGRDDDWHHRNSEETEDVYNRVRTYPPSTKTKSQIGSPTQSTVAGQKASQTQSEGFPDYSWIKYDDNSPRVGGKKGKTSSSSSSKNIEADSFIKQQTGLTDQNNLKKPASQTTDQLLKTSDIKQDSYIKPSNKATSSAHYDKTDPSKYSESRYGADDFRNPYDEFRGSSSNRRPTYNRYDSQYGSSRRRPSPNSGYPYYDTGYPKSRGRDRYPVWDPFKDEYYYPDVIDDRQFSNNVDYDSRKDDQAPLYKVPAAGDNILTSGGNRPHVDRLETSPPPGTVVLTAGTNKIVTTQKLTTQKPTTAKPNLPTVAAKPALVPATTAAAPGTPAPAAVTPAPADGNQGKQQAPVNTDQKTDAQSKTTVSSINSNKTSMSVSDGKSIGGFNILNADEVQVETYTDSSQGPIVALALGLTITMLLLIIVGCRLRTVKRRLRKGRALHSNEADYLINGMYL